MVVLDAPDGREIGVTDERRFAMIRAGQRPEAIWFRTDGKVRQLTPHEESYYCELRLK